MLNLRINKVSLKMHDFDYRTFYLLSLYVQFIGILSLNIYYIHYTVQLHFKDKT